jgi:hypothetical protein
MPTLKASAQGVIRVKQARNEQGRTVDDPYWLVEASRVLQPGLDWQEAGPFAPGISEGTWKKFLSGKKRINAPAFKAYCQVLGLPWEAIVNRDLEDSGDSTGSPWMSWYRDAPDVSAFYGRTQELEDLRQWAIADYCRLIMIFGIGGIGKTALGVKFVRQNEDQFERIVWRSLSAQPLLPDLIADILPSLTQRVSPRSLDDPMMTLMPCLHTYRCLIVLDQAESLLQAGRLAGRYREGYTNYGQFWKRLGTERHRSCVLLICQEELQDVTFLERETRSVRSLHLVGLSEVEARDLLKANGLSKEPGAWDMLVQLYRGNPFALRMIAIMIQDYFTGNVSEFLKHTLVLGDDIRYVLDQQYKRLSEIEKTVLNQLALLGHPQSGLQLQAQISPAISSYELIEALASLRRRSLIEASSEGNEVLFTLQPIVMKYVKRYYHPR